MNNTTEQAAAESMESAPESTSTQKNGATKPNYYKQDSAGKTKILERIARRLISRTTGLNEDCMQ